MHRDLARTKRCCYAKGTIANKKCAWKSFIAFCIFFQQPSLPASSRTLALYAQLLSRTFKSVSAIKNYISDVKTLHALLDFPTTQFDSMELSMTLTGLSRLNPHLPKRASPMSLQLLSTFSTWLQLDDPVHATFWSLFLVAFFSMSRKSNLVLSQSSTVSPNYIKRKHVHFHVNSVTLDFTWSKTNQFGSRVHKVPLVAIPNSVLCPVQALVNMLSLVPAGPEQALFLVPASKSKLIPVTYLNFQSFLKSLVKLVGLNPSDFSTHSFRRGGATHAFASSVPSELIKSHGDWSSDAYLVYLEFSFSQKLSVSKAMAANTSTA